MKRYDFRGPLFLFAAALIWGFAFVAQSVGMDYVGPFTFTGARSILATVVLFPAILCIDGVKKKKGTYVKEDKKTLLCGGVVCGIFLCIATNLQQIGLLSTTVGKSGFITAMYIILVPILGLFIRKKVGLRVWIGVVLSVVALYLLCITESFSVEFGDFLTLMCALCFAFQILSVDYFGKRVDGVKLSCVQFLVSGIISFIPALIFENVSIASMGDAWITIAYAGIMSSGVAYTFQIVGQKHMTNPSAGALIMSLESVVSVLAGFLLLHQMLSFKELAGCVIMFVAVIMAQLPERKKENVTK